MYLKKSQPKTHTKMNNLTFNEWQAHIARQLEADYLKIFNQPKIQINEKFYKISRSKSESVRGVSKDRVHLHRQGRTED
jgi:hypothetical protein